MKNDAQLMGDVNDELEGWPTVEATRIGVAARDGVVTLSGQVGHYMEKQAAEGAAGIVHGVEAVVNRIVVSPPGSSQRSDQNIAESAREDMMWDFEVPRQSIDVRVANGSVTLEGGVDWPYQREAAARCVRFLTGVVGVANLIAVKPRATCTDENERSAVHSAAARPGRT